MSQMSFFAKTVMNEKYSHTLPDGSLETWPQIAHRVASSVLSAVNAPAWMVEKAEAAIRDRKFMPGGRYLYASGRDLHQTQNCLLLRAQDSREGWSQLLYKASMALMTGAGIGVEYSFIRPEGTLIKRTGGRATGPLALMQMLNEAGRGIRQGGDRRSAIWAGLRWDHSDVFKFIRMKDWSPEVRALKEKDYNFPATMDGTNISVGLNREFFEAYSDTSHPKHTLAQTVYWETVRRMLKTAEPGFSINFDDEDLRNACTEVISADSDDICNLGSINMARVSSLEEMKELVEIAVAFLLAGTVYSDVPYGDVDIIRSKNRRLGLGLMGLHEWLLVRGKQYGPDAELEQYLKIYSGSTDVARRWATEWNLSAPVKTRAIAPTGTIGIVAETTTGIEPILCVAYKRRYLKGQVVHYQYVIDPCAQKLIDNGIDPESIEDAYLLAENVERRLAFQAWVQGFVDHAISSTINLPSWGSPLNNDDRVRDFGEMLIRYLPRLRGMTVYPDGARSGQPLQPVRYHTAKKHLGKIFTETGDTIDSDEISMPVDVCDLTKGGSCGA